ncbi:MAG: DUF5678 domain-containing protein [Pyrinomonadaceae bacterium]|nr:DUF5678 domain-containing protein [Pyrinomonadaceae bacterium]
MQVNFEQAIEIIKTLPPEDFRRLDEWIEERKREERQAQVKEQTLKAELEIYKKARKWINENSEKYMNQWVCLEGDELIAHGADGLEVHKEAVAKGIEAPFLHHIVDESLPFGGW